MSEETSIKTKEICVRIPAFEPPNLILFPLELNVERNIMPAIPSHSTILVTGANGYLGTWIVDGLLKRGYTVRASVRNTEKGRHLQKIFHSLGDKLQAVATGDITEVRRF
jgi:hypothetical protein